MECRHKASSRAPISGTTRCARPQHVTQHDTCAPAASNVFQCIQTVAIFFYRPAAEGGPGEAAHHGEGGDQAHPRHGGHRRRLHRPPRRRGQRDAQAGAVRALSDTTRSRRGGRTTPRTLGSHRDMATPYRDSIALYSYLPGARASLRQLALYMTRQAPHCRSTRQARAHNPPRQAHPGFAHPPLQMAFSARLSTARLSGLGTSLLTRVTGQGRRRVRFVRVRTRSHLHRHRAPCGNASAFRCPRTYIDRNNRLALF